MTRGKLHVEMLPSCFPGDKPEGAEVFVSRVRAALNLRFQGVTAPRVLFVDRGAGFYRPWDGRITPEFKSALTTHGLKSFMQDDASVQPGQMGDLMLHETAVAWIRKLETATLPKRPWEEDADAFGARLKEIVAKINKKHDTDSLCRELPERVEKLFEKEGGKLKK